jgi:hypothetical protein
MLKKLQHNSFILYWGMILIILPLYMRISGPVDPRVSKDLFLIAVSFASLLLFGFKKPVNKYLSSIFAVLSALGFYNQHDQYSITVIMQFVHLNLGFLIILQMISHFNADDENLLLNFLSVVCVIQSAWIFFNSINLDPTFWYMTYFYEGLHKLHPMTLQDFPKDHLQIIDGSLGNSNLSAALIAITAPTLFRKKLYLLLPLVEYALYKLDCDGAFISFLFPVFYYLLGRYFGFNKILIGSIGAFIIFCSIAFFVIGSKSDRGFFDDGERYALWKSTASKVINESPTIGLGLGYLIDKRVVVSTGNTKQVFWQLHNEYVEMFLAFGLVGLILLTLTLLPIFLAQQKSQLFFTCFLSFCVNCTINFPARISSLAIIGIIIYAFLIATSKGINLWRFQQLKNINHKSVI